MADRHLGLDVWRPFFIWLETGDDSVFPHFEGKAKCTSLPPAGFFPPNSTDVRRAKMFCNGTDPEYPQVCKVREQCLEYALVNHLFGVWGGTSERDRRKIRAARKAEVLKQQRILDARKRALTRKMLERRREAAEKRAAAVAAAAVPKKRAKR